MSVYTAGLLKVTTLDATGASAVLTANTANLTTLNADVVTTQDLTLTNLTIPTDGAFNVNGLNNYEGNVQSGDLISFNAVASLTSVQTDTFMREYLGPDAAPTFWAQDTSCNITVYKIVYWANSMLDNSITKLSATLLVPTINGVIPKTSAIISDKHGSFSSTYQNSTLWNTMYQVSLGLGPSQVVLTEYTPWQFATTGHVVVCADSVSYGKSYGAPNYYNVADEVFSQYAALVATTQLMKIRPVLFKNQFVGSTLLNVINSGYSLGGMFGPMISQFIANNDPYNPYKNTNVNTIPLNLIQTIVGSPVNQYEIGQKLSTAHYNNPTIWSNVLFSSLAATSPENGLPTPGRPSAVANCSAIWNPFYQNTLKNYVNQVPNLIALLVNTIAFNYTVQSDPTGPQAIYPPIPPYLEVPDTSNFFTTGYITPNQVYINPYYEDCSSYNFVFDISKQSTFYNNPFVDYSDLSGTPITVIYSTGDELSCNNFGASTTYSDTSDSIYVGTPQTDMIYASYKAWVDSSSVSNGVWDQRKPFLDLSGGFVSGGYTLDTSLNPIVSTLLAVENQNQAVCIRVNKDGLTPGQNLILQHNIFQETVYQNGVRAYLNRRT